MLASASPSGREQVACRLAGKALQHEQPLYIHAESDAQARELDGLLWTFRQQSFIPHERVGQGEAPVLIGHGNDEPPADFHLMLNLAAAAPTFASRFERIMDITDADEQRRVAARDRFRFYRDQGYPLQTYKL